MRRAAAAPAGDQARREKSIAEDDSVFARPGAAPAGAADVATSVDQAKFSSESALAALASGPLLMQETLRTLDDVQDVPFDQLCNDGSKVTAKNLLGKLARCTLTPIKEVYLPLMTWGLPTNHLMVRLSSPSLQTASFTKLRALYV